MSIPTYRARLIESHRLSPGMFRVTLGGDGLAGFESTGVPDERVKLFLSSNGGLPPLPEIDERGYAFPPGVERPISRTFTVRRWQAGPGLLDIDVAIHDGPAANWARAAQSGAELGIAGPVGIRRPAFEGSREHVLIGDSSALPAIARIVESLPTGAQALVLIEITDPADRVEFVSEADLNVHWLERSPANYPFGALLIKAADANRETLSRSHVWAGGEALAMRAIRKLVRDELGLERQKFQVSGYWRHRLDEDSAIEADQSARASAEAAGGDEAAIEDAGYY